MQSAERALVAAELARLCEGDALRRSPSHTRLLCYLVEHALAGDDAALTETAIAIAVFHRDPVTFDPHVDPIVRVAASRLRVRLASCHGDAGRALRIVLPPGGYVPRFVASGNDGAAPLAVLAMRNASGSAAHDRFCRSFARRLTDAVARAGGPLLCPCTGAGDTPASGLLDCVLSRDAGGALRVTVRLIDGPDGTVRWTQTEAKPDRERERAAEAVLARVAARLVRAVAGTPP